LIESIGLRRTQPARSPARRPARPNSSTRTNFDARRPRWNIYKCLAHRITNARFTVPTPRFPDSRLRE
jgi:hypothetical protein